LESDRERKKEKKKRMKKKKRRVDFFFFLNNITSVATSGHNCRVLVKDRGKKCDTVKEWKK
jgi:hypothetical protein